jgi:hypothetical protein
VTYGSGSFEGKEYLDRVSLGYGLVIENQAIGVASRTQGYVLLHLSLVIKTTINSTNSASFSGFDGILG